MSNPQKNKNQSPSQTGLQMRLRAPVGGRKEGKEEEAAFSPPVGEENSPATGDSALRAQPRKAGWAGGGAGSAGGALRTGEVRRTRGAVRGRGRRFLSAEAAACLLFPLQVPRGPHPAHQVHGHLRDHSILRGGCRARRRLGRRSGADTARGEPSEPRAEPPEPPRASPGPAPLAPPAERRCPGSCPPQRLTKGP